MKKIVIFFFSLALLIGACNKDDGPAPKDPDPIQQPDPQPEPQPVNNPPGTFGLINPAADKGREDLLPVFSWEAAADPDGDTVTYDLYVSTDKDPQHILATDISGTTYQPAVNLELFARYYWKVVAKDGRGGESEGTIRQFTVKPILDIEEYSSDGLIATYEYGNNGKPNAIVSGYSTNLFYNGANKLEKVIVIGQITTSVRNFLFDETGNLNQYTDYDYKYTYSYSSQNKLSEVVYTHTPMNLDSTVIISKLIYNDGDDLPSHISSRRSLHYLNGFIELQRKEEVDLEWDENDNLTFHRSKEDFYKDGQITRSTTYSTSLSYDTMQSPNHRIVADHLGFNSFYYEDMESGMPLATFRITGGLNWTSQNNPTKITTSQGVQNFSYTYNEEGYPIIADVERIGNIPYTITWKYVE